MYVAYIRTHSLPVNLALLSSTGYMTQQQSLYRLTDNVMVCCATREQHYMKSPYYNSSDGCHLDWQTSLLFVAATGRVYNNSLPLSGSRSSHFTLSSSSSSPSIRTNDSVLMDSRAKCIKYPHSDASLSLSLSPSSFLINRSASISIVWPRLCRRLNTESSPCRLLCLPSLVTSTVRAKRCHFDWQPGLDELSFGETSEESKEQQL